MTPAASEIKIFGDVLVPGAIEIALARILSAYRLYDPGLSNKTHQITHYMATNSVATLPGKRVWFRNSPEKHGIGGYISLTPGEFRTELPNGPNDIIHDPPPVDDSPVLGSLVWQVLKSSKAASVPQTSSLRRYQELAYRVLEEDSKTYDPGSTPESEGIELFKKAAHQVQSGTGDSNAIIRDLYQACLFEYRMSITQFASCMTLLHLQAMSGGWIDASNAFHNAADSLGGFATTMSGSDHRQALIETCLAIGTGAYREGGKAIQTALNSHSLSVTNTNLMLACHHYWTATIIGKLNDRFTLGAQLPYTEAIAEEGFCCSLSGLSGAVDFLLKAPSQSVKEVASDLAAGDVVPAVLSRMSSVKFPVFNKWFAKSLVAAAQTRTPGASFAAGMKLLLSLEKELSAEFPTESDFEPAWMDQCLLNAYQAAGDDENAKRVAIKIATRMVFAYALNSQDEPTV